MTKERGQSAGTAAKNSLQRVDAARRGADPDNRARGDAAPPRRRLLGFLSRVDDVRTHPSASCSEYWPAAPGAARSPRRPCTTLVILVVAARPCSSSMRARRSRCVRVLPRSQAPGELGPLLMRTHQAPKHLLGLLGLRREHDGSGVGMTNVAAVSDQRAIVDLPQGAVALRAGERRVRAHFVLGRHARQLLRGDRRFQPDFKRNFGCVSSWLTHQSDEQRLPSRSRMRHDRHPRAAGRSPAYRGTPRPRDPARPLSRRRGNGT